MKINLSAEIMIFIMYTSVLSRNQSTERHNDWGLEINTVINNQIHRLLIVGVDNVS